MRALTTLASCILLLLSCNTSAQKKETALTATEQQQLTANLSSLLIENYVFPELAKEMTDLVKANQAEGRYSGITDFKEFARIITNDLQAVSKDKHLRLIYDPEKIAEQKQAERSTDRNAMRDLQMQKMRESNFGFKEVKILEGNIGYINLTNFFHAEFARETALAAMDQVINSEALIFDLRENGGGSPTMIQLLSSYFFDKPVHLNSFYFRPTDAYSETWTSELAKDKKRPNMPIYILTSTYTFSAAEEFTYNLKNLKRATIIGEVTGGGAHPGGPRIISDQYMLWIPSGRAINPITNTNWEGIGVIPDIEVSSDKALETALQMAKSED